MNLGMLHHQAREVIERIAEYSSEFGKWASPIQARRTEPNYRFCDSGSPCGVKPVNPLFLPGGCLPRQRDGEQNGTALTAIGVAQVGQPDPAAKPGARLGERDGGRREGGPRPARLTNAHCWRPPAPPPQPIEEPPERHA